MTVYFSSDMEFDQWTTDNHIEFKTPEDAKKAKEFFELTQDATAMLVAKRCAEIADNWKNNTDLTLSENNNIAKAIRKEFNLDEQPKDP